MKNKLPEAILIIFTLVFLFSQPSLGIELQKCQDCHGKIKPLSPITKDCMVCHSNHGDPPPEKIPEKAHAIHAESRIISSKKECQQCHTPSSARCETCHNSHENIGSIKLQTTAINTSICTDCHGNLPQPGGHSVFRIALSNSKHQWMNCRTCHLNVYNGNNGVGNKNYNTTYELKLHFKDLFVTPIEDSINLCKICHSSQYKGLKEGTHGSSDKKCVDCHNPHTTKLSGPNVQITPQETLNISASMESAGDWITTKVPILKNTTTVFIIFIIMMAMVAEHVLSKEEEGKKTAYHTVKIHGNEDGLKTLEIKLKNQDINTVNEILERNDVNILGMTMTKEKDKGMNIYKYIIFMDMKKPINEVELINEITTANDIKSAIFTDKYEL